MGKIIIILMFFCAITFAQTAQFNYSVTEMNTKFAKVDTLTGNADWDFWCIIRYVPADSSWAIINNSEHASYHIDSVTSTKTGNGFIIYYYPSGRIVGTVLVTNDESTAGAGLTIGASVGLTSAIFKVVQTTGFSILMNGTSAASDTNVHPTITSSWSAVDSQLTIVHSSVGNTSGEGASLLNYGINIIPSTSSNFFTYRIVATDVDRTTAKIEFYNASGTKVAPTGEWYYNRAMPWKIGNDKLVKVLGSTANFWIFGRFVNN